MSTATELSLPKKIDQFIPGINDLQTRDIKELRQLTFQTFTSAVDYLRFDFPNEDIKNLMALFTKTVTKGFEPIIPLKQTDQVVFTAFKAEVRNGRMDTAVLIPKSLPYVIGTDNSMQLGAIVQTASRVEDYNKYWFEGNIEFLGDTEMGRSKARQFEARFLKSYPNLIPNEYQQYILSTYG